MKLEEYDFVVWGGSEGLLVHMLRNCLVWWYIDKLQHACKIVIPTADGLCKHLVL